jgi:hypothetical protein
LLRRRVVSESNWVSEMGIVITLGQCTAAHGREADSLRE